MSFNKLQIKLLSKSGELLNVVNCFCGQITVLRANSIAELHPYQRVLSGIPGPEKFSITLDGQPFNLDEHNLLGFGKDLLEPVSLAEFLLSFGIPKSALKSLLMSYGLDSFQDKRLDTLADCPRRRALLLAATFSPDKVLILNNPFEPLSNEWKDSFSDLILTYAKNKKAIVVITSLSYRPQTWVGNESVARVQVGLNMQRTIGYGGDQAQLQDMLAQVRSSLNNPEDFPKLQAAAANPTTTTSAPMAQPASQQVLTSSDIVRNLAGSWVGLSLVLVLVALSLGAVGLYFLQTSSDPSAIIAHNTSNNDESNQSIAPNENSEDTSEQSQTQVSMQEPVKLADPNQEDLEPAKVEMANANFVLDSYDSEVKKSILATFLGEIQTAPVSAKREPIAKKIENKKASSPAGFDLLNALATADESGKDLPDNVPQSNSNSSNSNAANPNFENMSKDERRALLREKFRQAIERAQQRRAEEQ